MKFLFINYGSYRNGVLLELIPKGGGGATPFDTDYTWSYLLGNDILTAFTVSVYNTDTKKIKNFYFSDNDVASYWLDIPYDKHRLEEIRKKYICREMLLQLLTETILEFLERKMVKPYKFVNYFYIYILLLTPKFCKTWCAF